VLKRTEIEQRRSVVQAETRKNRTCYRRDTESRIIRSSEINWINCSVRSIDNSPGGHKTGQVENTRQVEEYWQYLNLRERERGWEGGRKREKERVTVGFTGTVLPRNVQYMSENAYCLELYRIHHVAALEANGGENLFTANAWKLDEIQGVETHFDCFIQYVCAAYMLRNQGGDSTWSEVLFMSINAACFTCISCRNCSTRISEIWGSHSGVADDSGLVGCYAKWRG
jgi:hypothetical protein